MAWGGAQAAAAPDRHPANHLVERSVGIVARGCACATAQIGTVCAKTPQDLLFVATRRYHEESYGTVQPCRKSSWTCIYMHSTCTLPFYMHPSVHRSRRGGERHTAQGASYPRDVRTCASTSARHGARLLPALLLLPHAPSSLRAAQLPVPTASALFCCLAPPCRHAPPWLFSSLGCSRAARLVSPPSLGAATERGWPLCLMRVSSGDGLSLRLFLELLRIQHP